MIDRQLQSLKDTPIPAASDAAKARALAAAAAAYATAPAVEPVRVDPRPFVLRHGYKIAASLAALAVIGPMLALFRAPEPAVVQDASTANVRSLPAKSAAELKVTPPAILAAPSERQRTAAPAQTPVPPVATDATTMPTQRDAQAAPAAPATRLTAPSPQRSANAPPAMAAQPAAKAPAAPPTPSNCPPGRACITIDPGALLQKQASRDAKSASLAPIAQALLVGRLPDTASIDALTLLNAFNYPTLAAQPNVVATAALPWSPGVRVGMTSVVGTLDEPTGHTLRVGCDGRGAKLLHRDITGLFNVFVSSTRTRGDGTMVDVTPRVTAVFEVAGQTPECVVSVQHTTADIRVHLRHAEMPPSDIHFALAVLRFAELMRGTAESAAAFGYTETIALAEGAKGADPSGERASVIELMRKARDLAR